MRCECCGSYRHAVESCPDAMPWELEHAEAWQEYIDDAPSDVIGRF